MVVDIFSSFNRILGFIEITRGFKSSVKVHQSHEIEILVTNQKGVLKKQTYIALYALWRMLYYYTRGHKVLD